MKALIQRVTEARVEVDGTTAGRIGRGLLVFLGVMRGDTETDLEYVARKVSCLRIFANDSDKMDLSLLDVNGSVLVVSQFTLAADCRKGNRPSFDSAADPAEAAQMYNRFAGILKDMNIPVATGRFGAHMQVYIANDGPVTILLDSKKQEHQPGREDPA